MAAQHSPRGLIVDLVTPLDSNRGIDGRSLAKHLERVLPHVQAVFLAGPSMGEGENLEAPQREELMTKALAVVRGRVPVLVWITQETEHKTRETLEVLSKRMKTKKCAGQVCWVDTPLCYHSNRGLVPWQRNLTSSTQETWFLHNDPDLIRRMGRALKRNNIRTSILAKMMEIQEIQGLLYLGSLDRAGHYEKTTRTRPDFRIYDGDESRFLAHPSLSGVVSAGANLSPKAWSRITKASLGLLDNRGDYPDRLHQIWRAGRYLRALLDLYALGAVPIIKQVLAEAGTLDSPTSFMKTGEVGEKVKSIIREMRRFGDDSG